MAIRKFVDGVPVHEENIVYLNDWMRQEKGYTIEGYRHDLIVEGLSEEQIDQMQEEVEEEFFEWCEDHDLRGETC